MPLEQDSQDLPRVNWGEPVDASAPAWTTLPPQTITWEEIPSYAMLAGRWNVRDMAAHMQPGETEGAYMVRAKAHALVWAEEDAAMVQAVTLANEAAERKKEANRQAQQRWRERNAKAAPPQPTATLADVVKAKAELEEAELARAAAYKAMAEARAQWDKYMAEKRRAVKLAMHHAARNQQP